MFYTTLWNINVKKQAVNDKLQCSAGVVGLLISKLIKVYCWFCQWNFFNRWIFGRVTSRNVVVSCTLCACAKRQRKWHGPMSILLSVTSRSSVETHERIELVRIFPKIREHCSNVCAMYLANKLSSSETLSQTPDLDNFATAYRSLKRVINLAPQMDADSVINWTIVGLSWQ